MAEKLPSAFLIRPVDVRFYRAIVGGADAQQALGGGRAHHLGLRAHLHDRRRAQLSHRFVGNSLLVGSGSRKRRRACGVGETGRARDGVFEE